MNTDLYLTKENFCVSQTSDNFSCVIGSMHATSPYKSGFDNSKLRVVTHVEVTEPYGLSHPSGFKRLLCMAQ